MPPPEPPSEPPPPPSPSPVPRVIGRNLMRDVWRHAWGKVAVIAGTIALVSWALRETASVTWPIADAIGSILVPLLIGFTIAYMLTPVIDLIAKRGFSRLLATMVIFSCFLLVGTAGVVLGVPAIINQSSELMARLVRDQPFLDHDGNGLRGEFEPLLRQHPQAVDRYFHDRNENQVPDPGEPVYARGVDPVRVSPSVARHVLDWFGQQQTRVRRYVGAELSDVAVVFLEVYRAETAAERALLDEGLRLAEEAVPREQWPSNFFAEPAGTGALPADWGRAWPGVAPRRFEEAAFHLQEPADEAAWRTAMSRHGLAFLRAHRRCLLGWQHMRSGTPLPTELPPETAARVAAVAEALSRRLHLPITAEQRQDLLALAEELHVAWQDDHPYAEEIFQIIEGSGEERQVSEVILDNLNNYLRSSIERASTGMTALIDQRLTIGSILGLALDLLLIPIYAFFLVLAMPAMRRTVRKYLPNYERESVLRVFHEIERVVAAFFRGRLIVCFLCGVLVSAGFLVLGVPYAVLFGFLIGLATAVPLAGLLFLVPALLLAMMDDPGGGALRLAMIIAVYTVVQALEMTVFTPLIMGREVELHPVTLIIALLFFGKIMGVLGLIAAVPIAAALRILAREFVLPRLRLLATTAPEASLWEHVSVVMSRSSARRRALPPRAPAADNDAEEEARG